MKKRLLRVLVLEDNFEHAQLITGVLEANFAPVDIHTIDTVENCIEFLLETDYDLVLTNCFLKGRSIIEHLPRICAGAGNAPVVVITGSGDEKLAAEAIKAGAQDYLVKSRESLTILPKVLSKHLKRTHKKRAERKDEAFARRLLSEVESLTERTKRITSLSMSPNALPDPKKLKQIFDQINKLKELANKLLTK